MLSLTTSINPLTKADLIRRPPLLIALMEAVTGPPPKRLLDSKVDGMTASVKAFCPPLKTFFFVVVILGGRWRPRGHITRRFNDGRGSGGGTGGVAPPELVGHRVEKWIGKR